MMNMRLGCNRTLEKDGLWPVEYGELVPAPTQMASYSTGARIDEDKRRIKVRKGRHVGHCGCVLQN